MKTVYLAGPITGETYGEATDWRRQFAVRFNDNLKISCRDPMRGKQYLDTPDTIKDEYAETQMSSARGITTRDRIDTLGADMIVMNLLGAKRVSIGSMIEAGWSDTRRVPLVLVMEPEGNVHHHSMLREIAAWIVPSLDAAEHIVRSVLL